jgi:hypothetical protein
MNLPLHNKPTSHHQYSKNAAKLHDDREESSVVSDFPKRQDTPPVVDTLGSTSRHVSVFRDAHFMRELQTLVSSAPPASVPNTLLVITPLSPSTSSTLSQPSFHLPTLQTYFNHASPYLQWWEVTGGARAYRKPAPWRDVTDQLAITYRHLALKASGQVQSFTLNLSPEIEAKARSKASPQSWLQKRIASELKALGRDVEFHFVLEEAEQHRLHVHGEMQIAPEEAAEARAALRRAGGRWDGEAPQAQAHSRPDPDAGWVQYLVGDLWRVQFSRTLLPRYRLTKLPSYAITYAGKPTSCTVALNAKATKLYELHRTALIQSR